MYHFIDVNNSIDGMWEIDLKWLPHFILGAWLKHIFQSHAFDSLCNICDGHIKSSLHCWGCTSYMYLFGSLLSKVGMCLHLYHNS